MHSRIYVTPICFIDLPKCCTTGPFRLFVFNPTRSGSLHCETLTADAVCFTWFVSTVLPFNGYSRHVTPDGQCSRAIGTRSQFDTTKLRLPMFTDVQLADPGPALSQYRWATEQHPSIPARLRQWKAFPHGTGQVTDSPVFSFLSVLWNYVYSTQSLYS